MADGKMIFIISFNINYFLPMIILSSIILLTYTNIEYFRKPLCIIYITVTGLTLMSILNKIFNVKSISYKNIGNSASNYIIIVSIACNNLSQILSFTIYFSLQFFRKYIKREYISTESVFSYWYLIAGAILYYYIRNYLPVLYYKSSPTN